jgi:hypothetical protein
LHQVGVKRADAWLRSLAPSAVRSFDDLVRSAAIHAHQFCRDWSLEKLSDALVEGVMDFHHSLVLQLCTEREETAVRMKIEDGAHFSRNDNNAFSIVVYSGVSGVLQYTGQLRTYGQEVLYCSCQAPDDGRDMVQCDGCNEWYHPECLHETYDALANLETFNCPRCRPPDPDSVMPDALSVELSLPLAGAAAHAAPVGLSWKSELFWGLIPLAILEDPLVWAMDLYDMQRNVVRMSVDDLSADRNRTRMMKLVPGSVVWVPIDGIVTADQLRHSLCVCELVDPGDSMTLKEMRALCKTSGIMFVRKDPLHMNMKEGRGILMSRGISYSKLNQSELRLAVQALYQTEGLAPPLLRTYGTHYLRGFLLASVYTPELMHDQEDMTVPGASSTTANVDPFLTRGLKSTRYSLPERVSVPCF